MTKIKFGCQLPLEAGNFEEIAKVAEECERLGYDSVWSYDHLRPFWTQRGQALECWTLLAAIAQRTEKIKLGSLVTNVNLRNPALLAKMTSTLDNICGGRLIVGLGTGDRMSRDELLSYGYSFPCLDERLQRLRETIIILKSMWGEKEVTYDGKYYKLSNAINFPKPIQKPHPPIWIGGKNPRILDTVAEMADGWNYWGLEKKMIEERSRYLNEKCGQIDRPTESIVKSWAGTMKAVLTRGGRDRILGKIASQTDDDTRYFIASFGPGADPSSYEAFAEAVKNLE